MRALLGFAFTLFFWTRIRVLAHAVKRRLPTEERIKTHVKEKYGDWTINECSIPDVSDIVIKQMCKIMRPPELRNKR